MIVLGLDRDEASHLATALTLYRRFLEGRGCAWPPRFGDLLEGAEQLANGARVPATRPKRSEAVSAPIASYAQLRDREYLSPKEAALVTGLSPSTIRRAYRGGSLPVSRTGRSVRIARSDLDHFMNQEIR